MSDTRLKTAFITFYSFKGGVGRSMALINTAGILAGRGFRVLVIDLDLEAPGLSYLDPNAPDVPPEERTPRQRPSQPGFVDLLSDAKERGEAADLFNLSVHNIASRYTQTYHLPEELSTFKDGSLHIMPAGKFDGHYAQCFDALNLHELYQVGLGEPLIRAFKKKLVESEQYDYVLIDSRTGFSDEAGICTRDLADHLMILSGLNRQNIQGTCEFLRALRSATDGKKTFQIILSPVPNGEDALLDQREAMAKASFSEAWGAEVDLSLQIPYHPQLALTEEPHIFRRRRGYLFEAYRAIERQMLMALGHDPKVLLRRIEEQLRQKDYVAALRDLRYMVRLDDGTSQLVGLAFDLATDSTRIPEENAADGASQEAITLEYLLDDAVGQQVVGFIVDCLPLSEELRSVYPFLQKLKDKDKEAKLADKLYKRLLHAKPDNAFTLGNYALFLQQRGDLQGAKDYYRRALEADPTHATNLGNYALFLEQCGDLEGAKDYYRRALEADPTHATNLGNYALFLEHCGDIQGAQEHYLRALEVDPKHATHLGNYALFLEHCGDIQGANGYYLRALEVDPKHATYLGNYALFLERGGDIQGAQEHYQRALKVDPKHATYLGNYALFLEQCGDIQGAQEHYQRALKVDPKHVHNLRNYGLLLVGIGQFLEGEQVLVPAFDYADQSKVANIAEICFSLWLVARMRGNDAARREHFLKFLIQKGFKRHPWNFDRMLNQARKFLSPEEVEYAEALVAAFLDESQVSRLEQYERWQLLEPHDLKKEI